MKMRTEDRIKDIEAKEQTLEKKFEEHSFVYEILKKSEREKKRWFAAWLVTFILLLSIIAGGIYLYATSEIDVFTLTQTTENGGDANYIGGNYYGTPESNGN